MSSKSHREWVTTQSDALDEMVQAHAAVGGVGRGRRHATQQINRSYAVLLAAQFQGFCRDFHTECADHLVNSLLPAALRLMIRAEFTRDRKLDRGNAQPSSIGSDFGRLGVNFWAQVRVDDGANEARQLELESLNTWRNAIVHQDFDPTRLGGRTILRLSSVRRWRTSCEHLATSFDAVMLRHLSSLTGSSPW